MSGWARWWRLNLVGMLGAAVQLLVAFSLGHVLPGHPQSITAFAVECAVLHNFSWHLHYTWPDRQGSWLGQLLRFQLANGLVSLAGSAVVVQLVTQGFRAPLLLANALAIVVCSVANFGLGQYWVFRREGLLMVR